MRRFILLAVFVATCGGCRTAEFAVQHPMTGLHVVAKFATQDEHQQTEPHYSTTAHAACEECKQMPAPLRLPAPLGG